MYIKHFTNHYNLVPKSKSCLWNPDPHRVQSWQRNKKWISVPLLPSSLEIMISCSWSAQTDFIAPPRERRERRERDLEYGPGVMKKTEVRSQGSIGRGKSRRYHVLYHETLSQSRREYLSFESTTPQPVLLWDRKRDFCALTRYFCEAGPFSRDFCALNQYLCETKPFCEIYTPYPAIFLVLRDAS